MIGLNKNYMRMETDIINFERSPFADNTETFLFQSKDFYSDCDSVTIKYTK